jgi:hypothetical protein
VTNPVGRWCCAAALVWTCCARAPELRRAQPLSAADYYPLAVGNRWTYRTNFLGEKSERRVEIVGHRNGFYVDSQGQELTVDALGVRDQKRYLLREPLEVGRTWTNVVSVSSVEHYQVKDIGAPCEAPAGVFQDCVRIESRNPVNETRALVNEITFAPRVGIVRIEITLEAGGKRIPQHQYSLKEFTVNSKAAGPLRSSP